MSTGLHELQERITLRNLIYLVGGVILVRILQWLYWPVRRLFSPLRLLPGPKSESVLFGNMRRIFSNPNLVVQEQWAKEHGTTFAYRGVMMRCQQSYRLFTLDIRALTFILSEPESFTKPKNLRQGIVGLLGQGLFFAEGDTHKRQRRIMNPAFGSLQIRELLPVFWQKASQLKDIWLNLAKLDSEGKTIVNVLPWLSRATLDIIGVAGFDYHFNSLENDDKDELSVAFKKGFQSGQNLGVMAVLQGIFPIFQTISVDERSRGQAEASATMRRIGAKLIADKQAALSQELKTGSAAQGRDLLTLLIKSNMAFENEGQRMTQDEVLGQISTFLVAGHETTGTSTTWALYALAKHLNVQRKLRQELLDSGLGDEPSMTDLDKLTYLDNFVHECLRLYPAVPATLREAAHEVRIPVSRPYTDRNGAERTFVALQKGDGILVPILAMNRDKGIWGSDAMEFRPERWDNLPETAKDMPGVWGHLMTFAHGGRSCIGFRFALIDIMSQSDSFQKPNNFRQGLAGFLGQGLLFAESDVHKRQRRIMNPSFGSPHVRALLPIFWEKSIKLKDILLSIPKSHSGGNGINVLPWISHTTLDIIGVAGFDYHFNSLDNEGKNELSTAFRKAFQSGEPAGAFMILQRFIPIVRYLSPDERSRAQTEAATIMRRIGVKLIAEKRASLAHELKTGSTAQGRDLLTLLIKSNMAYENEGQRMTDEEVLAQISTFLFAGHETTSTSTAWALYALTQHPEVQRKLRQELLESGLGDEPSMTDLDKLSYLDNVVHETLRLYPAVPATVREAAHDVHIPVSSSFKDRAGAEHTSILVQKGDMIILPILAMNRSKDIWGEDSTEFRPERWDNLPEAAKTMPGVWGHLMTFIQGNRSCIGYRFAVAEMKALLYTLVRAIEFDIDPSIKLESKFLSARPLIISQPERGNQVPLICKPVIAI
ncbi:hypothetical protein FRC07_012543 [Ceratobasidium sp. 392]|nr:hypothetical protein FRC07_012543 [Ceratobasidium sp. 392]